MWCCLQVLSQNFPAFQPLPESMSKKGKSWRPWWSQWRPEAKVPDYDKIGRIERLLLNRSLRPDKTYAATLFFIRSVLGDKVQGLPHKRCLLRAVPKAVKQAVVCC